MCTIPPDPDVSGIGVRVAVYIQAVVSAFQFALIPLLLHTFRKGRHLQQAKQFHRQARASSGALLITCMAILISAAIKIGANQFSRYHAVIVLNMSWLLCLCALSNILVILGMERAVPHLKLEVKDFVHLLSVLHHTDIDPNWVPFRATFHRFAIVVCFATLGVVGIMVHLIPPMVCPDSTVVWMFGREQPLPDVVMAWLYYFTAVPAASYLFAFMPVQLKARDIGLAASSGTETPGPYARVPRLFSATLFLSLALLSAGLSLFIIVATETIIAANDVAEGEMVWGFGQTLAIILAASPVWEALRTGWDVIALWMVRKPEPEFELLPVPQY